MTGFGSLAYMSVADLATAIRSRQISPVEAVQACIDRIGARNDTVNAFVHTAFEEALDQARKAEQALVDGDELGALHGVPTAIKDLFDFKPGWPATFGGIRALADFSLDAHCAYAERMERPAPSSSARPTAR